MPERLQEDRRWLRLLAPSRDGGRMVDRQRSSFIDHTTPTCSAHIRLQADTAAQAGGTPPEFPAAPLTLPLQGGGNSIRQHHCSCRSSCGSPAINTEAASGTLTMFYNRGIHRDPIMTAQLSKKGEAWSARFSEPVSDLVKRYTASVFFDKRL